MAYFVRRNVYLKIANSRGETHPSYSVPESWLPNNRPIKIDDYFNAIPKLANPNGLTLDQVQDHIAAIKLWMRDDEGITVVKV